MMAKYINSSEGFLKSNEIYIGETSEYMMHDTLSVFDYFAIAKIGEKTKGCLQAY